MGLTGARVDAIAERTNTTKRMLYYYFGSKEGLYEAVLETGVWRHSRARTGSARQRTRSDRGDARSSSNSRSTITTSIAISCGS